MDAPTSPAISYGVFDRQKGREMLRRYWQALEKTSFSRFDLGVPPNLQPVPKEEMEHYTKFQVVAVFGEAKFVKRLDGQTELRGGTDQDRVNAKEWIALFWHEAVLEK